MEIFENVNIGTCTLNNRIIRSATFEGMCDERGFPGDDYFRFYEELARQEIGGIITGFAFISKNGKAMQPGQAGLDSNEKVPYFREMTDRVHQYDSKVFIQLAHSGRQTLQQFTGGQVMGCSSKRSSYFKERPKKLNKQEIHKLAEQFGEAAFLAREAGFDGVQIHAAHGYLVHQFIISSVNNRKDEFGIDKKERIGKKFLKLIIKSVRNRCGADFPLIFKISGGDDYLNNFTKHQFVNLVSYLDKLGVDAIEVSYGTMDYALNIFRGDFPAKLILDNNPFYKNKSDFMKKLNRTLYFPIYRNRLKSFEPMYNLEFAKLAKLHTAIPVITVGGFRSKKDIGHAILGSNIDFVSMSRPFLAEPDLVKKIRNNTEFQSKCCNCNYCSIMCDTDFQTKCYKN